MSAAPKITASAAAPAAAITTSRGVETGAIFSISARRDRNAVAAATSRGASIMARIVAATMPM